MSEPWYKESIDNLRVRFAQEQVRKARRHELFQHQYKRKHIKRRATPSWANHVLIEQMYVDAWLKSRETKVRHVVDHIIPLQGEHVCGLHVHENMQVIPHTANGEKHNSWWGE